MEKTKIAVENFKNSVDRFLTSDEIDDSIKELLLLELKAIVLSVDNLILNRALEMKRKGVVSVAKIDAEFENVFQTLVNELEIKSMRLD